MCDGKGGLFVLTWYEVSSSYSRRVLSGNASKNVLGGRGLWPGGFTWSMGKRTVACFTCRLWSRGSRLLNYSVKSVPLTLATILLSEAVYLPREWSPIMLAPCMLASNCRFLCVACFLRRLRQDDLHRLFACLIYESLECG